MEENYQNSKVVVGLDIGTTKICAIVGCLNKFGKLEILGMGQSPSLGVVRGMVQNIDKAVSAIEKAIREAKKITDKPTMICCKTIIGKGSPN